MQSHVSDVTIVMTSLTKKIADLPLGIKMENLKTKAVIKSLGQKDFSAEEFYKDMVSTLGKSALSYATIKMYVVEIVSGSEDINDEDCYVRPKAAPSAETVTKVHDLVKAN